MVMVLMKMVMMEVGERARGSVAGVAGVAEGVRDGGECAR
jgi:hypothetical protein